MDQVSTTSITASQVKRGVVAVMLTQEVTTSNVRSVPYAEIYRDANGIIPSPIQRFQEAARDEGLLDTEDI